MSVFDPSADLVATLIAASPYSLTAGALTLDGTSAMKGKPRPPRDVVKEQAVFVEEVGGQRPDRYMGVPNTFKRFLCIVVVRSAAGDYLGGQELARVLLKKCSGLAMTGYEDTKTLQAGPDLFLEDDNRMFYFRFGVELWAND